jgi:RNA ligase
MINKQILKQYLQDGLVTVQSHPTLSLHIWNYTAKVQYENLWDEYPLLIECRGLVTDYEGNIISKGFEKFFNLEENRHTPTDQFEIYEKMDGQFIGVFWYNNELVVNSRGSFTSPYAIEAKRLLFDDYPQFIHSKPSGLTFCFELIGFEQIVVSYEKPQLILTGIFNTHGTDWFEELKDNWDLKYVEKYDGLNYTEIKKLNWQNHEGFVVKFTNGYRCKIKFDDYVRLHRQMTNLSTAEVWESLRDGKPVSSILNDVPDEFYDKIKLYENNLKFTFGWLNDFYDSLITKHETTTRKEFANFATKCDEISQVFTFPVSSKVLFAKYDNNTELADKLIWNSIKPKFEKI